MWDTIGYFRFASYRLLDLFPQKYPPFISRFLGPDSSGITATEDRENNFFWRCTGCNFCGEATIASCLKGHKCGEDVTSRANMFVITLGCKHFFQIVAWNFPLGLGNHAFVPQHFLTLKGITGSYGNQLEGDSLQIIFPHRSQPGFKG